MDNSIRLIRKKSENDMDYKMRCKQFTDRLRDGKQTLGYLSLDDHRHGDRREEDEMDNREKRISRRKLAKCPVPYLPFIRRDIGENCAIIIVVEMLKAGNSERDIAEGLLRRGLKGVQVDVLLQLKWPAIVGELLADGKTKEDIARRLKTEGLSDSEVGILLHESPLGVQDESIRKHSRRLRGQK